MRKKERLSLFYLAEKGLIRFKFSFFLKLGIIIIWGLLLYNLFMINNIKTISINNELYSWIFSSLFIFLNLLAVVFIITITTFTLRLRKDEFGLYRCSGGTRGEIFLLVINESFILSFLSIISVLILEAFLIFYFRPFIINFFRVTFDLSFILKLGSGFVYLSCFITIGLLLCYIPFGFYYAFKDPYNIVRY